MRGGAKRDSLKESGRDSKVLKEFARLNPKTDELGGGEGRRPAGQRLSEMPRALGKTIRNKNSERAWHVGVGLNRNC